MCPLGNRRFRPARSQPLSDFVRPAEKSESAFLFDGQLTAAPVEVCPLAAEPTCGAGQELFRPSGRSAMLPMSDAQADDFTPDGISAGKTKRTARS